MRTEVEIKQEVLDFLKRKGAQEAGPADRCERILRGAISFDVPMSDEICDRLIAARDYSELRVHSIKVEKMIHRYLIEVSVSHYQPPLGIPT